MRGFTSDILRKIYQAAIKQGWTPDYQHGSNHASLICPDPRCGYREAFSLSARGKKPELNMKLSALRGHSFVWKGRGGTHTAPYLHSSQTTNGPHS